MVEQFCCIWLDQARSETGRQRDRDGETERTRDRQSERCNLSVPVSLTGKFGVWVHSSDGAIELLTDKASLFIKMNASYAKRYSFSFNSLCVCVCFSAFDQLFIENATRQQTHTHTTEEMQYYSSRNLAIGANGHRLNLRNKVRVKREWRWK